MEEDTNNQLLHQIAGVDENTNLTNNQLLKIIAGQITGGGENAGTLNGEPGTYYLDRTNHTGTQAVSTVDGLQAALDDKVDKISSQYHVYATGAGGVASPRVFASTPVADSIMSRRADGTTDVGTPTAANNAATKAYVDGRLSEAQRTAIDALDTSTSTVADIINALQAT